jgi:tripartite-type tricarboxylate transporter receptor subunit TctC
MEEAGVKGFIDTTFNGLVAPAGTPPDILEKLRAAVAQAVTVPALRDRFGTLGIPLVASRSLDEFNAFLRRHVEEFAVLAKTAGIKAN